MSDDLYHQEILDHYYHPDNFGTLKEPDHTIEEANASCGDMFTFTVKLKDNLIKDINFTGTGCAISTAASSLLTGKLIGQPVSALKHIDLEYMQELIGAQITPARVKCLMLPARALQKIFTHE